MQTYYHLYYGLPCPVRDEESGYPSDDEIQAKPFLQQLRDHGSTVGKEHWSVMGLFIRVGEMQSTPLMSYDDFRSKRDRFMSKKDYHKTFLDTFQNKVDLDTFLEAYGEPNFYFVLDDQ